MELNPLYIDPGTGSALFSILIGIAATVYFLGRGLILKLGIFIFRKKKNFEYQYKYVIYAEDKRYWSFFEIILDELEKRNINVHYLTTSEDDPIFSSKYDHIEGKYIGSGNKAYAFLNFLSAEFLLTTTPNLDVFQWKRSKNIKHYCHMVHGAGGAVLYHLYSFDYFDSVLVPNEKEIPELRILEQTRNTIEKQLVVVGNSFFDRCAEKIKQIPNENPHIFTVLVSPSWGKSALLSVFGEKLLDPLSKTGWRIIVRPHPQSLIVEKLMIDSLIERYKDNTNIEWDYNHENIYSLSKSDVMLSDFSGIIFDYVFLFNKPVIVNIQDINYKRLDAQDLNQEPYFIQAIKKIGIQIDSNTLVNIKEIILNLSQDTQMQNNRNEVIKNMWMFKGESGKNIVDFMIQTSEKEKIKIE
ncbi:MAG: CDP-glycerol glycerophosphotransferase family protein [Treponema sp.]|nr:CDP-glycerol glycerophosphotransferase family protein [Treponema sp.]MCL2250381.1 CDP-glycerol glycerophosphotransferase family protein [Treponema sp.]